MLSSMYTFHTILHQGTLAKETTSYEIELKKDDDKEEVDSIFQPYE